MNGVVMSLAKNHFVHLHSPRQTVSKYCQILSRDANTGTAAAIEVRAHDDSDDNPSCRVRALSRSRERQFVGVAQLLFMPPHETFVGGCQQGRHSAAEICYIWPIEPLIMQIQGRLRMCAKLVDGIGDVNMHFEAFSVRSFCSMRVRRRSVA